MWEHFATLFNWNCGASIVRRSIVAKTKPSRWNLSVLNIHETCTSQAIATRLIYNFSAFLLLYARALNTQHALCHIHFKNNSKIPAQNLYIAYTFTVIGRQQKKKNFARIISLHVQARREWCLIYLTHKNRNNTHSPSSQTMYLPTDYTFCMVFLLFKNAQNCDDDTHIHAKFFSARQLHCKRIPLAD